MRVARSYMRLTDIGNDVTVARLTVRPGALLDADEHGVLQIPAEALPSIIEKAELIRADEQNVADGRARPTSASVSSSRSAESATNQLTREFAASCRSPSPSCRSAPVPPSGSSPTGRFARES